MTKIQPVANFIPNSMESTDRNGAMWARVLDKRFCAEVVKTEPYKGVLRIFDSKKDFLLLHETEVTISYDAMWGPDANDCAHWSYLTLKFVEEDLYNG